MSNTRDQRLAQTFVSLADTLVVNFDVLDFLGLLAERAAALLDVDAAGVVLADQRGGWRPTAGSSERAELVELFAAQTLQGPCLDCVRSGTAVVSADLAAETDRWPDFVAAALRSGFHAACAVPMRLRGEVIGALTLLNTRPVAVDDANVELAQALADIATIGILQQRAVHRDELVSEQLQAALHHRTVIEQAKGVIAEIAEADMQRSYEKLRDYARAHQMRLVEVAHGVVTGELDVRLVVDHSPGTVTSRT